MAARRGGVYPAACRPPTRDSARSSSPSRQAIRRACMRWSAALEGGGVYRSEDGGESWSLVSTDARLGVDIRVHPKNADVVFAAGTASYRSDDGGRTWTSMKGAPGGDDYQRIWINPLQPDFMLLHRRPGRHDYHQRRTHAGAPGTTSPPPSSITSRPTTSSRTGSTGVSRRAARSASRAAATAARSTFRDWMGVGADEYAYVAPGPAQPGHRLWRPRAAVQQEDRPVAERGAGGVAFGELPDPAHDAAALPSGRPEDAAVRHQRPVEDDDRRRVVGHHQPRPVAGAAGGARERGRLPHAGPRDDAAPRRHLCRRPLAPRREHDLGRDRRWARARHPRWRAQLDERDATELRPWDKVAQVDAGHFDVEDGLSGGQRHPARRPAPAHLQDPRRRRDVGQGRRGFAGRAARSTWSGRIPNSGACCSREPSARCSSPWTTATTGNRFG